MSTADLSPLRPSPGQLAYQRAHRFGVFCHFGINTFHGRDRSDGTLPAASFDPGSLDCRQWARAVNEAGARHIILTAKHHDGFCLWPTATTDYSVRSAPWRSGQGDVVAELAHACAEFGLGLGLYLSPWDRHEPSWGDDYAAYDRFYLRQLEELCANYGDLFELWFDEAGSEQHPYDWPSIMALIHRLQPRAMIFNMGAPTVRWVGNEDGLASDPCWYAVDATQRSIYDDGVDALTGGAQYLPPECDIAIRRPWFWHDDDVDTLKSRQHLEAIWYRSVGLGANLLLDVPPDTRGLIDERDRERLVEFGQGIRDRLAQRVHGSITREDDRFTVTFPTPITFDHLVLEEAIERGQRIRRHRVLGDAGNVIVDGVGTVGSQRVHAFPKITTGRLIVEVDDRLAEIARVSAHLTGVESAPGLEDQPPFQRDKID